MFFTRSVSIEVVTTTFSFPEDFVGALQATKKITKRQVILFLMGYLFKYSIAKTATQKKVLAFCNTSANGCI